MDKSGARRIVTAADLGSGDVAIEIGPGRGALTGMLVETACRLILVELDDRLAAELQDKYENEPQVSVLAADARDLSPAAIPECADRPYKVVGNLPYYAASPIIRNLLETSHPPAELVVMVQREVGREMIAEPGKMGLLSVATQFYAEAKSVCSVSPRAFSPPPKVYSAVVKLTLRPEPAVKVSSRESFFILARAGFAAPRKTIMNSLALGIRPDIYDWQQILSDAEIDAGDRPAMLSLDDWVRLHAEWRSADPIQDPAQEPVA
jgi:16S rRNA (adenine1518-N6/adenine1519-N6)-dimethyltransferase